jgi:tryptophanyl-tRNA synthetase
VVVDAFAPIRERTEKMLADEATLDRLLAQGAQRVRPLARQTMTVVNEQVGFMPGRYAG